MSHGNATTETAEPQDEAVADFLTRRGVLARVGLFGAIAPLILGPVSAVPWALGTRHAEAASDLPTNRCPEQECSWLYNPAIGDPDGGIPPGIAFEDLPEDWVCPECGTPKYLW